MDYSQECMRKDTSIRLRDRLKHLMTRHRQGTAQNIFIFSTARSGTTWLAELFATQGRFKIVNEPFNLRQAVVRDNLKLATWESLFEHGNRPAIRAYLQAFIDGADTDPRFKRETPFSTFWHPQTDRIIFKILFAGEDDPDWYRTEFNGSLIFLLRHPIAVALSRTEFPRLRSFLSAPFAANFSVAQLRYAERMVASGDVLQIAVLDWCLQNAVPFRQINPHWIVLSYEEMVTQPAMVVEYLVAKLGLRFPERMMDRVFTASGSTSRSSDESKSVLGSQSEIRQKRRWLIEKWRERVSPAQEACAFETLEIFEIDFYRPGRALPAVTHLLSQDRAPVYSPVIGRTSMLQ